jgi:hypothetical protein
LVALVAEPLDPTLLGKVGNTGNPKVDALGSVIPFGNGNLHLVLERDVAGTVVGKSPGPVINLDGDRPTLSPGGANSQLAARNTFGHPNLNLRVRPDDVSPLFVTRADRLRFGYERSSTVGGGGGEEHDRITTDIAKVIPVYGEDLANYKGLGGNAVYNG